MKRERKLVRKYVKYWVHFMGLGYWDIAAVMKTEKLKKKGGGIICGRTWVEWKYCTAYIEFYINNMAGFSEQKVEEVVVHELTHVLLNEMQKKGIDHEERVATMMRKAMIWTKYAYLHGGKSEHHKR